MGWDEMKQKVAKLELEQEFYTAEKCYITEVSNSPDDPTLSIARTRVEVGVTTAWHRLHGVGERYVILSGLGRVELGDSLPKDVATGDIVLIPPRCPQRITTTGEQDLIFLAICSPRFTPAAYQDIEGEMT